MKETLLVKAEEREAAGSNVAGRLRRTGWVPGVVYGEGKPARNIRVNEHDFARLLSKHHGEHMLMDLAVGGAPAIKVLLQDAQRHPVTGRRLHVDFHEISMTRKLRVRIPLALTGDPVGVTQQGGILDQLLREVEVECLPADLMEQITVDVSALELGKHLSVRDIRLDAAKFAVLTPGEIAIAAVSAPKAEEVAATPAEGAAAAEPEVITAKKEEGEGAAEGAKDAKTGGKDAAKDAKGGKEAKPAADKGEKGKEKK